MRLTTLHWTICTLENLGREINLSGGKSLYMNPINLLNPCLGSRDSYAEVGLQELAGDTCATEKEREKLAQDDG